MEADVRGFREGHDVVIAILPGAHESDDVLCTIGEPHAQRARKKFDAAQHVRRKQQHMTQAQRTNRADGGLGLNSAPVLANQAARHVALEGLARILCELGRCVEEVYA